MACLDSGVSFSKGMRNTPRSLMTVTSEAVADTTRPLMREPSINPISVAVSTAIDDTAQNVKQMNRSACFMVVKSNEPKGDGQPAECYGAQFWIDHILCDQCRFQYPRLGSGSDNTTG